MYTNGPLNHSTSLLYMENHYISFQHVITKLFKSTSELSQAWLFQAWSPGQNDQR